MQGLGLNKSGTCEGYGAVFLTGDVPRLQSVLRSIFVSEDDAIERSAEDAKLEVVHLEKGENVRLG